MFRLSVVIVFILYGYTLSYAGPDAVVIPNGDLRIKSSGSGLVFPDGSIQYKAVNSDSFYTKTQIDQLVSSVTSLIPLQSTTSPSISVDGTTVNVSWNPVPEATGYNLYYGTNPGLTKTSQKVADISTTNYQHMGLTRGTVYFYAVSAIYPTGEGALSPEVFKQVPFTQANPIREFEPNNTQATANVISIGGGSFRGQLSSGATSCNNIGDYDYYRFQSNGGVVKFSILPSSRLMTAGIIKASILSEDGVTVIASTNVSNSSLQTFVLSGSTITDVYLFVISPSYDSTSCPTYLSTLYSIFTDDYIITPEYSY
jgi:hypothetical protein